jgi:DNA helicase HerA-like ATPase
VDYGPSDTRGLICIERTVFATRSGPASAIDPRGADAEKLDVLIVSRDIRSAGLLARKLAETGVSAVIDIYDLPGKEDPWVKRRMFVSELISELMNLPKKLYHPMIVMVDEAHQFAQEETTSDTYIMKGVKVNPSLLSRSAVRILMSAGRKRGSADHTAAHFEDR